jgi:hypothetical protein
MINVSSIKRVRMTKYLFLPMALTLMSVFASAQDLHYADVETMNIWYNQSLKMDKRADVRFNFRDIKYQSVLAFRTSSALVNVPILRRENRVEYDGKSFLNVTAGGAFDRSNKGAFKNSTGMLGLSYSQRLTDNLLFLSAGFQGTFTRSQIGSPIGLFPDQFDQYGPLPSGTLDPLRFGRSFNWASLNAGLSLYQNTEYKEWYFGGSIRHINRPFVDEQKTEIYRLAPTLGLQAGLTVKNESEKFGIYGIANWKAQAYEYLLGARFTKIIDNAEGGSEGSTFGGGIAVRLRDAVIPHLQLKLNKTVIALHYDLNISGLKASGYSRQGIELAISRKIN